MTIGYDELQALIGDDELWARAGARAANPAEFDRVSGEYMDGRGFDPAGLTRFCAAQAQEDTRALLAGAGRALTPDMLAALVAMAYEVGILLGVEAAKRYSAR